MYTFIIDKGAGGSPYSDIMEGKKQIVAFCGCFLYDVDIDQIDRMVLRANSSFTLEKENTALRERNADLESQLANIAKE